MQHDADQLFAWLGAHPDGCPCGICRRRLELQVQLEIPLQPPSNPALDAAALVGDDQALEFEELKRAFLGEGECECLD